MTWHDVVLTGGVIFTFLGFFATAITTVVMLRQTLQVVSQRLQLLEGDLKEMTRAIGKMAVQDERLSNMDGRLLAQGKRVDETMVRVNNLIDNWNRAS